MLILNKLCVVETHCSDIVELWDVIHRSVGLLLESRYERVRGECVLVDQSGNEPFTVKSLCK